MRSLTRITLIPNNWFRIRYLGLISIFARKLIPQAWLLVCWARCRNQAGLPFTCWPQKRELTAETTVRKAVLSLPELKIRWVAKPSIPVGSVRCWGCSSLRTSWFNSKEYYFPGALLNSQKLSSAYLKAGNSYFAQQCLLTSRSLASFWHFQLNTGLTAKKC